MEETDNQEVNVMFKYLVLCALFLFCIFVSFVCRLLSASYAPPASKDGAVDM